MSALNRLQAAAQVSIPEWTEVFPEHRPFGVYNAYVPVELFEAVGLTPVYLFHRSGERGYSRAHLPAFCCWPGRSLVDQAMAGELDGLIAMALGQTCDVVQALTDVWRRVMPAVPLYHVGIPGSLAGSAVRSYFVAELEQLREALGGPGDEELRRAISKSNETRHLMECLYDRAGDLLPTELYAVLRAGLLMPREAFNHALGEFLDSLSDQGESGAARLVLVGPHLADPLLYQLIEDTGARVVDDLLDLGHRYFSGRIMENGSPLSALVDHYLALPHTPTKYHPGRRRATYLKEKVIQRQADGVIFARFKFCDPHGFDLVALGAELAEIDVPYLALELEGESQAGQIGTRIEAYLEMVIG
jgi:benzoyl-CoA reductase/2-hydroxyglutaryl-CoA dehydratase subunit BcrC/BadD/HgdB